MMPKIKKLIHKGVRFPNPDSVEIGEEVDVERISGERVSIHSGCKIFGRSTLILQGATIGYQGPSTIENCCVGPEAALNGGYFKEVVFLKKSNIGHGAYVREGTILEEEANAAHTVALKQTILFPYVTLGSLINFCDCLMSGGTSRKDHSEVGSSYIHFNYTPNQDKATPSLLGDVPRGVMLNNRPIFLGGQGGIVGPCRLSFGTVTAAGTICRRDEPRPGRLIFGGEGKGTNVPYVPGMNQNTIRVFKNNIIYIANLIALMQWYLHARSAFISKDFPMELFEGLKKNLNLAIEERINRLRIFCGTLDDPSEKREDNALLGTQKKELQNRWAELEAFIRDRVTYSEPLQKRESFLTALHRDIASNGKDYIQVIKGLDAHFREVGTQWLQEIVDHTLEGSLKIVPL